MKFVAGIILVVFVSFGRSVILSCKYGMRDWDLVGNVYECMSQAQNTENSTIIEEVRGEHLSGKANEDVELYWEQSKTMTSIPTNLASFFPNLKAILLYSPILQLSSSDLKSFPNLLRFEFWGGKFANLDGDLFQYTRKLKVINFHIPGLKNVGENLLTGLNLIRVTFFESGCIGTWTTLQSIQELNQKLLMNCPPLEPLTSPMTTSQKTTTLSTSTSTQCTVRCSLDSEVDEMNAKFVTQIAKLKETNNKQEERLVELEMMIREINAKP
jgi:hypothetical protein